MAEAFAELGTAQPQLVLFWSKFVINEKKIDQQFLNHNLKKSQPNKINLIGLNTIEINLVRNLFVSLSEF